jgi:hypothetical protein
MINNYNWAYGWGVMDSTTQMRIMSGYMTKNRDCASTKETATVERPFSDRQCFWRTEPVRIFIRESYDSDIADTGAGTDDIAVQTAAGQFIKRQINRQMFNRVATGGLLWWLFRR